jgi:hypothetical protein
MGKPRKKYTPVEKVAILSPVGWVPPTVRAALSLFVESAARFRPRTGHAASV